MPLHDENIWRNINQTGCNSFPLSFSHPLNSHLHVGNKFTDRVLTSNTHMLVNIYFRRHTASANTPGVCLSACQTFSFLRFFAINQLNGEKESNWMHFRRVYVNKTNRPRQEGFFICSGWATFGSKKSVVLWGSSSSRRDNPKYERENFSEWNLASSNESNI